MARLEPDSESYADRARARGVTVEAGDVIYHPDVTDYDRRPLRFPPHRSTLPEHAAAISDPDLGNTLRAAHELLQETRAALDHGEPLPSYARDLRGLRPLDADPDVEREHLLGHLRLYREQIAASALAAAGLRHTPSRLTALASWISNDADAVLTRPVDPDPAVDLRAIEPRAARTASSDGDDTDATVTP